VAATAGAPRTSFNAPAWTAARIGPEHHVWIEQREQRVEVTVARGSEEGVDHFSLPRKIIVEIRGRCLDPVRGWRARHTVVGERSHRPSSGRAALRPAARMPSTSAYARLRSVLRTWLVMRLRAAEVR
jgi:hypothetical protein